MKTLLMPVWTSSWRIGMETDHLGLLNRACRAVLRKHIERMEPKTPSPIPAAAPSGRAPVASLVSSVRRVGHCSRSLHGARFSRSFRGLDGSTLLIVEPHFGGMRPTLCGGG
jgi:hypothetical protein